MRRYGGQIWLVFLLAVLWSSKGVGALYPLLSLFRRSSNVTIHSDKRPYVDDPSSNRHLSQEQFEHQIEIANDITVAGITLYVWEYLATLPRELSIWSRPRELRRPQMILFLLVRYATLPCVVLPAYTLWHHFTDQSQCPRHHQVCAAVVQFLVSCIFSWRTIAIWRRNRIISVGLSVFTLLVFAVNVGLLYYANDALISTGACRPTGGSNDNDAGFNTVMYFYIVSMIFDAITLFLSLYKLFLYANMGRQLEHMQTPDPLDHCREKDLENAFEAAPRRSWRQSSAANMVRHVNGHFGHAAMCPVRLMRAAHAWWSSLTPLVARLIANGLVYFFVASAYNGASIGLEAEHSIHAKSFLALYPPLMCVLCQRMLIAEFDAVWTRYDPEPMYPGRQLVDRVMNEHTSRSDPNELNLFEHFASSLEQRHASVVGLQKGADEAPLSRFSDASGWNGQVMTGSISPRCRAQSLDASPRASKANMPSAAEHSSGNMSHELFYNQQVSPRHSLLNPPSPSPAPPSIPPEAAHPSHSRYASVVSHSRPPIVLSSAQHNLALRMAGM